MSVLELHSISAHFLYYFNSKAPLSSLYPLYFPSYPPSITPSSSHSILWSPLFVSSRCSIPPSFVIAKKGSAANHLQRGRAKSLMFMLMMILNISIVSTVYEFLVPFLIPWNFLVKRRVWMGMYWKEVFNKELIAIEI